MILYLDTSALVKLFIAETHSARVRAAVAGASVVATQLLAYAEACSAFARLAEARDDRALFGRLRRELDARWPEWDIVGVDEPLVRRASELCERWRLRAYDSLHLAAAEAVRAAGGGRTDFLFVAFDTRLSEAARQSGMPLLGA